MQKCIQPIICQKLNSLKACRRGQEVLLFFRPNVKIGKKWNSSDFECGIIVGARQVVWVSQTTGLLVFSHNSIYRVCKEWCEKQQQFCGQTCLVNERGQRRRDRLVKADQKVTVTLITTHYNGDMQKSIYESHNSGFVLLVKGKLELCRTVSLKLVTTPMHTSFHWSTPDFWGKVWRSL